MAISGRLHRGPMTLRTWTLLVASLLAGSVLAGCAGTGEGGGDESQIVPPPTTQQPPAQGGNGFRMTVGGFEIDGPTILPLDGRNRTLREDDGARIAYTLRAPAEGKAVSAFVTFALNGQIVDVQTVTLQPGDAKAFEKVLPAVRDLKEVRAEVRSGSAKVSAHSPVDPWPRTGETTAFGNVTVRVERWLKDPADGSTLVNVTIDNKDDKGIAFLHARILCSDEKGNVTAEGFAEPALPTPGSAGMSDIRLPGCPHTLYGVEFKGKESDQTGVYGRILFVEAGWRPPVS